MMSSAINRIGRFEKVSLARFEADYAGSGFSDDRSMQEIYDAIELPVRATAGSAGYDFHTPCDIKLGPGESIKIITGIRVYIAEGWMLLIAPRSGLGTRYRVQLNNTIGIIDSDYYYAENEGHIQMTITNDSKDGKVMELKAGDRFIQGIFVPHGITEDDAAVGVRNGGFGSTALR